MQNLSIYFNEKDETKIVEIVLKFDFVGAVKLLRKHGWNKAYTNKISEFNEAPYTDMKNNHRASMQILHWFDDLMKTKDKILKRDLEIRISGDAYLNKENCKIKIFDGICEATKQSKIKQLPAKFYKNYNIEHINAK